MKPETAYGHDYESTLINILRVLSPDYAEQLGDFARFLEGQLLSEEMFDETTDEEMEADNARWDALLDSDKGQALLEKLATEALTEHRAGLTLPTSFDSRGRPSVK